MEMPRGDLGSPVDVIPEDWSKLEYLKDSGEMVVFWAVMSTLCKIT